MTRWLALSCVLLASVAGAQEATYIMRGPQLPVSAARNGFVQTVVPDDSGGAVVHVATVVDPIEADGLYGSLGRSQEPSVPEGFSIPSTLRIALRPEMSVFAAATQVLEWVMTNLELDVEDRRPQDAVSVLRRGRGRCSGLANVTTGLLLAAGFEARTVSGLLISPQGAMPHRWVECHLPGSGWVPTDPTLGLWTVTSRHVVFTAAVEHLPEVVTITLRDDNLALLPKHRGWPLRPNRGAELVCRLVGQSASLQALAVLHGPGGETRRCLLGPEGRFSGLLPGRWLLVVHHDGEVLTRHEFLLESGDVNSFAVEVEGRAGS